LLSQIGTKRTFRNLRYDLVMDKRMYAKIEFVRNWPIPVVSGRNGQVHAYRLNSASDTANARDLLALWFLATADCPLYCSIITGSNLEGVALEAINRATSDQDNRTRGSANRRQ